MAIHFYIINEAYGCFSDFSHHGFLKIRTVEKMNKSTHKNENMNNLFLYIEGNLMSDLDAELLSNVGYVSYAQLYRDFYNLTGHSVKEYIRKRRLSNALALMKTSNFGLSDIAFQCGYSSHQALCRAVRQTLGLTPSEYKNSDTYYFFPPFCGEHLQSVIVSNENVPKTHGILFYQSSPKDIENKAIQTFLCVFPEYEGRIFGRNGMQEGNRFSYVLYLTATDIDYNKLLLYGFELTDVIPCTSSLFATTTVRNDEQKINAAWDYLYFVWLQNSMFEYTNEPYFEEYILKNGKVSKLKLYLPIKKRIEEMKITLVSDPRLHFIVAKAKGYNAEKHASQKVIDYLSVNYPYIIKTSKEIYLHKEMDLYVCGVKMNSELQIIPDKNIESIATDQGYYLILESCVMGDYDRYMDMLLSFARGNGMTANRLGLFAVYDMSESYDNLKIKMYCPVKIDMK